MVTDTAENARMWCVPKLGGLQLLSATFITYAFKRHMHDYFVICAIPAQKKANMKALRNLLNAKEVGFATKDELKDVTGCNFGELAPVGKLFGVLLLMESDLLNEDEIFINAGRLDVSFAFHPRDLQRIENPIVFTIAP